jgi:ABC-2 type transport system permease protein
MNTSQNAPSEFRMESPAAAPAVISPARRLYWAIRRELWENRSVYLVPLVAAVIFLLGFLISVIRLRRMMHRVWTLNPPLHHQLTTPYEIAAALIMGTGLIVGVFYSLDALYGERRDRSILFWKSLPVSDLITVLSKMAIPVVVIPLTTFLITMAAQFIMLLLSSLVLLGSGVSLATLWTNAPLFHVSGGMLYHILTVHGLWYAPIFGWLLLVSACSPRAPFIWAALPPFVIWGVEKLAFNTSHFLNVLAYRFTGPDVSTSMAPGSTMTDLVTALTPLQFFSLPGLWIGLAVSAAFLYGAVRLRRYRGPA